MQDKVLPWQKDEWAESLKYPGVRVNMLQRIDSEGCLEVVLKVRGGEPWQQEEVYWEVANDLTTKEEAAGGKLLNHIYL